MQPDDAIVCWQVSQPRKPNDDDAVELEVELVGIVVARTFVHCPAASKVPRRQKTATTAIAPPLMI